MHMLNALPIPVAKLDHRLGLPSQAELASMSDEEVHLWRVAWNAHAPGHARHVLSPDELERAARFKRAQDRDRYGAFRAALRQVLSLYAGLPAHELSFIYGPHGKPALACSAARVHFNLTHSQDFGLFAISRSHDVGIDVEWLREVPHAIDIARRYFPPDEAGLFDGIDASQCEALFLLCWTRLEARLKEAGISLAHWSVRRKLSALPHEPRLTSFEPAAGFIASLAVARGDVRLICRDVSAELLDSGNGR